MPGAVGCTTDGFCVITTLFCGATFGVIAIGPPLGTVTVCPPGIVIVLPGCCGLAGTCIPGCCRFAGTALVFCMAGFDTAFCAAAAFSSAVGIIDLSTYSFLSSPAQEANETSATKAAAVYNFNFINLILVTQFTAN